MSAATVRHAIKLGEYFTAHALAAFDAMRADPLLADAEYVLEIICRSANDEPVTRRDLFTAASRSRFPRAADLDPVIALLVEHAFLAPVELPERTGPGCPPHRAGLFTRAHAPRKPP